MKKNDLLLVAALLIIGGVSFFIFRLFVGGEGSFAVVEVNGKTEAKLSLDKNTEYLIQTADGETNLLIIENGEAYIKEASCPDDVCVRTGRIKERGEMIVCLPHKLIVTVEGEE